MRAYWQDSHVYSQQPARPHPTAYRPVNRSRLTSRPAIYIDINRQSINLHLVCGLYYKRGPHWLRMVELMYSVLPNELVDYRRRSWSNWNGCRRQRRFRRWNNNWCWSRRLYGCGRRRLRCDSCCLRCCTGCWLWCATCRLVAVSWRCATSHQERSYYNKRDNR